MNLGFYLSDWRYFFLRILGAGTNMFINTWTHWVLKHRNFTVLSHRFFNPWISEDSSYYILLCSLECIPSQTVFIVDLVLQQWSYSSSSLEFLHTCLAGELKSDNFHWWLTIRVLCRSCLCHLKSFIFPTPLDQTCKTLILPGVYGIVNLKETNSIKVQLNFFLSTVFSR